MADRVTGLVRSVVVHGEPYEWELSNAVIAARFGLHPDAIIRFDLNTSPFPPASWDQAMEAARRERRPHEYVDTSYAELTTLIAAYLGVLSPLARLLGLDLIGVRAQRTQESPVSPDGHSFYSRREETMLTIGVDAHQT